MNVSGQDINQTLEYRSATAIVRLLPTGLLLVFLGLVIFALVVDPDREEVWTYIVIIICVVVGGALVGFTLWRRGNPGKPLFALSPDGIRYRIPLVKEVLIPWHQIQGVDTIDVETGYWSISWLTQNPTLRYEPAVVRDVTVILLPRPFYDQRVFVDSILLRGPGWKANFIPKGSLVQMALHHELVSVEPGALRAAVEARWLAFREKPAVEPARTRVPSTAAAGHSNASKRAAVYAATKTDVVAMGENPKAMSGWEAAKIIAPLIGIAIVLANLAGLWQLPGQGQGQAQEREARAKAREERKYWEESARKRKEETKRLEAEDRERREEFERDMRRVFGR